MPTLEKSKKQSGEKEFAALLEEYLPQERALEGRVIKGKVCEIEHGYAVIDIGLKTEGRVPLRDMARPGYEAELEVGDMVDVYVERVETALGEAVLSCVKAQREQAWENLTEAFEAETRIEGAIVGRVKGGFTVDLGGATAFLPGSQVDVRPMRDVAALMNKPEMFQILKMDRRRSNIVVSRRAVLEERRAKERDEMLQTLAQGQTMEGIVKNITNYGAFVDLGGIDGLLHVTQISWKRIHHPSEILKMGDAVKVQIMRINPDTQKINLSMKQLESDPWDRVLETYPKGSRLKGVVTNVAEYGAFIEIEPGVEGLVHVSEMSWIKKNAPPSKLVLVSQEVDVEVLDIDIQKRRISLGMRQCMRNPYESFAEAHPVGSRVKGTVGNITEFGLFVGLENELDGMAHISDLDWTASGSEALARYKKGEEVETLVLDIDVEKARISLGIKQLDSSAMEALKDMKKGDTVTCAVAEIRDNGVEVTIGKTPVRVFIKRADLSRERGEQRPDRFTVGQKLDAHVTEYDPKTHKILLSVKALEIAEEKAAVAQYGSSDSGASLGDILGSALKKVTAAAKTPSAETPSAETPSAKTKAKKTEKTEKTEKSATKAKTEKTEKAEKAEETPKKAKTAKAAKTTKTTKTTKTAKAEKAEKAEETEKAEKTEKTEKK